MESSRTNHWQSWEKDRVQIEFVQRVAPVLAARFVALLVHPKSGRVLAASLADGVGLA